MQQYYRSDHSPNIERIDIANAKSRNPKQILFLQESVFEIAQSNCLKNAMKEGKDKAFNRIINEGAPVGLWLHLMHLGMLLIMDRLTLNQILWKWRGYL